MKELTKRILKFFGYQINKYKNIYVLNSNHFLPIKENDYDWKLNSTAFKKSKNKNYDFWTNVRYYSLTQLVKQVLKQKKVYDFAELGCWKGHSSYITAELIKKSKKKILFHIFDSFEGLSKSTSNDKYFNNIDTIEKKRISKQFSSSEIFIKNEILYKYNFIKTYKGWIPKKFFKVKNKKFSLVFIDLCMYKPTLASLEFFYPRLVKGGIIISNSYNSGAFPGETAAWNKYFKNKKVNFFFKHALNGSFIIK
mgnify:FL=1